MSGQKRAYIRPNYRQLLRQECAEVDRFLDGLPLIPCIDEIEKELSDARKEARRIRAGASASQDAASDLMKRADLHREDLSLLLNEAKPLLQRAEKAVAGMRAELATCQTNLQAGLLPEVSALALQTNLQREKAAAAKTLAATREAVARIALHRREMKLWTTAVNQKLEPAKESQRTKKRSKSELSPEQLQDQIAEQAILSALRDKLEEVSKEPLNRWTEVQAWLGDSTFADEHTRSLQNAKALLAAQDIPRAKKALELAETVRAEAAEQALRNRQAAERNQQIAEAVMQALCDRHYNTPQYGYLKQGDQLSGLQIRADVPNRDGKGNIRIDLHIDGTTVFELENVPNGEEQICRNMVTSIAEAVSKADMNLEVKDWGRASNTEGKKQGSSQKLRERARERVRD